MVRKKVTSQSASVGLPGFSSGGGLHRWELALKNATPSNGVLLAADYAEPEKLGRKFASYALSPLKREDEKRLERHIDEAINRHIPRRLRSSIDLEIHLKDIWPGSKRLGTDFSHLENLRMVKAFLLEVANSIRRTVPFSVVFFSDFEDVPFRSKEKRRSRARALMEQCVGTAQDLIADYWKVWPSKAAIWVDRGDGLNLGDAMPSGYFDSTTGKLVTVANPSYIFEESSKVRLVQVADFAAYVAGRLLLTDSEAWYARSELDYAAADKALMERKFWLRLADILNLHLVYYIDLNSNTDFANNTYRAMVSSDTSPIDQMMLDVVDVQTINWRIASSPTQLYGPPGYHGRLSR